MAFNAEQTIAETLNSVISQSHSDIEYIVIDGASTDRTCNIIQLHDKYITQMISESDQGIYDAMNKGLRMATGEIIGFLNADDVYADNGVLARVSAVMEAENLDATFGDAEFFNEKNPNHPLRRFRSHHFNPRRIAWGWMPAHPTLFLRRYLYDRFGLFRTDYRIAGDFELVARMFHGDKLKYRYVPEVLVRMRTGGVSTGGWRNTLLLNQEVLRACRENGIETSLPKILLKYPAKLLEYLHR